MNTDNIVSGKTALQNLNPDEAFECFNKAENILGCAYCKFLTGEIEESKVLLTLIKNQYSFANWLLALIDILLNKNDYYPTYFQIRNFYEQDLGMLFLYKQYKMIEKILNKNTYLENFNKEVYKYSARVLNNNNYPAQAEKFIKKSLDIWYKDPESHFILGEIYLKGNETEKAKNAFKKALETEKNYYPAELKLKSIS